MGKKKLLKRAYEVVHHDPGCAALGGHGDDDCQCDAVPFLRDLEAVLRPKPKPMHTEVGALQIVITALEMERQGLNQQVRALRAENAELALKAKAYYDAGSELADDLARLKAERGVG